MSAVAIDDAVAGDVLVAIDNVPDDRGIVFAVLCSEATYNKSRCEHFASAPATAGKMTLTMKAVAGALAK
ncbi:MAG: hypothetical protein AAGJ87_16075, partial [Pseudomonadota bacterium]